MWRVPQQGKINSIGTEGGEPSPFAYTIDTCRDFCRGLACDVFEFNHFRDPDKDDATDNEEPFRECWCGQADDPAHTNGVLRHPNAAQDAGTYEGHVAHAGYTGHQMNDAYGTSNCQLAVNSFALDRTGTCHMLHTVLGEQSFANTDHDDPQSVYPTDLRRAWECAPEDESPECTHDAQWSDASNAYFMIVHEQTYWSSSIGNSPYNCRQGVGVAVPTGNPIYFDPNSGGAQGVGWVIPSTLHVPAAVPHDEFVTDPTPCLPSDIHTHDDASDVVAGTPTSGGDRPVTLLECLIIAQTFHNDLFGMHGSLQTISDHDVSSNRIRRAFAITTNTPSGSSCPGMRQTKSTLTPSRAATALGRRLHAVLRASSR